MHLCPIDWENGQQDEEAAINEQVNSSESHQQDEAVAGGEGLQDKIWTAIAFLLLPIALIFISVYWVIKKMFSFLMALFKLVMFISGYEHYVSLKYLKERCTWSVEVMNNLICKELGVCPQPSVDEHQDLARISRVDTTKMETTLLIAAKHGVVEMVERILDVRPDAIFEASTEQKNIVMLAAENRHPDLYEFLLNEPTIVRTIFEKVDNNGNSVLHITAKLEDHQRPWPNIRGAALQMHMEVKWFNYVKDSMPYSFVSRHNHENETPEKIFEHSHKELKKEGRQWLIGNSQSCSVVAALIATVAFATSATFPGGFKADSGVPTLENDLVFLISAVASLTALCSSMVSVVMFLGILTSNFQQADFLNDLPFKHLVAMISLLISILSMLVCFLAGHQFVLKQKLKHAALPVYIALCLPLLYFIIKNFPLDYPTVRTTLRKKPQQCGSRVSSQHFFIF